MKKMIFSLMAFGMFAFANAASIDPVKTGIDPVKKEVLENKVATENKEVDREVHCSIWTGEIGGWQPYNHSCFFCWGGAMNGCYAAAAKHYNLIL